MGLFWDYFKKTLRFPLVWKPGPLGIVAEGGAGALDQAHGDERWLRDQFLPTEAESQYLNDFAKSRGLTRFPEETDTAWYTRIKTAYVYWKSGGKVSGLTRFLESFGFSDIVITELSPPEWAQFCVSVDADDGASTPGISLLVKLINEMKPARSKLKETRIIGIFGENTFELDGEVTGDDGEIDDLKGCGSALSQGENTSVAANKLVDSAATFQTDGVSPGMTVYNDTDETDSVIVTVDSETQLTLDTDIFTATDREYTVNEDVGGKFAYLKAAA